MKITLSKKVVAIVYASACAAFIAAIIETLIWHFVFHIHNWLLQGIIMFVCQLIIMPFFFLIWKKDLFNEEVK